MTSTHPRQDRRAWTEAELALLEPIASRQVTKTELAGMFPDRTVQSAKRALQRIRAERGIIVTHEIKDPQYRPSTVTHELNLPMLERDDPGLGTTEFRKYREMSAKGSAMLLARLSAMMAA